MHRLYEDEDITVFWDSEKCRHEKKCVSGSPRVFEFGRRPWIDLSKGETAKTWQTIASCPSGALSVVYNHGITIRMDEEQKRCLALLGDAVIGECDFYDEGDSRNIYHTEVSPEYGGKGIAKRLVYKVTEAGERKGLKPAPTCSYAVKVLG